MAKTEETKTRAEEMKARRVAQMAAKKSQAQNIEVAGPAIPALNESFNRAHLNPNQTLRRAGQSAQEALSSLPEPEKETRIAQNRLRSSIAAAGGLPPISRPSSPDSGIQSPTPATPLSQSDQMSEAGVESQAPSRSQTPLSSLQDRVYSEEEYLSRIVKGQDVENSKQMLKTADLENQKQLMSKVVRNGNVKGLNAFLSAIPVDKSAELMKADYFGNNILETARDSIITNLSGQDMLGVPNQDQRTTSSVQDIQSVAAILVKNGAPISVKSFEIDPNLDTSKFLDTIRQSKIADQIIKDSALAGVASRENVKLGDLFPLQNAGANLQEASKIANRAGINDKNQVQVNLDKIAPQAKALASPILPAVQTPSPKSLTPPGSPARQTTGMAAIREGAKQDLAASMQKGFVARQGNQGAAAPKNLAAPARLQPVRPAGPGGGMGGP